MGVESDLIFKTILESCNDSNFFKDFWFPLGLTIFTAVIGLIVGIYIFKYQKYIEEHKSRLENFNELILVLSDAFQGLVSIKGTYVRTINSDPLHRAAVIRDFLENIQNIKYDLSKLSFLVSLKSDETYKYDSRHELLRISALINNYNKLACLWRKRDESKFFILKKISEGRKSFGGSFDVDIKTMLENVGEVEFYRHINLTEMVIRITDDLLIEMFNLLCTFKTTGEDCIDTYRIERFGQLIRYKATASTYEILKRSPEVDYELLGKILREDQETLKSRFFTGYECAEIYQEPSQVNNVDKNIEKETRRQYLVKRHAKWW